MKKTVSLLFALCFILFVLSATSFATVICTDEASLKHAIDTVISGDTIQMDADITVSEAMVFSGKTFILDMQGHTLTGTGTDTVIIVRDSGDLTIKGDGTITRTSACTSDPGGGGIYNNADLKIEGCTITGCTAPVGGGIYNQGELTVKDCTITGCSATDCGGGIYSDTIMTIESCTITGCTAPEGGGIINFNIMTIESCTITGCTAKDGGGIHNKGDLIIEDCAITGCSATDCGGGAYVQNDFAMNGGKIDGCSARTGGGICAGGVATSATFKGGTVTGCSATDGGGGIHVISPTDIEVSGNVSVTGNTKAGKTSNLYLENDGQLTQTGNLSGTVGVTIYGAALGAKFGEGSEGLSGSENFTCDTDPGLAGQFLSGTGLVWAPAPEPEPDPAPNGGGGRETGEGTPIVLGGVKGRYDGRWLEGAYQHANEPEDLLRFRVDVPFSKFRGVSVDGITLSKDKYSAYEGSTVVELSKAYLRTLTDGAHGISLIFDDGTAETGFYIGGEENPDTGAMAPVGLLALAGTAVLAACIRKKR